MEWYQKTGQLPYKKEWPELEKFEPPKKLWRQQKGKLPYKLAWPSFYTAVPFVRQEDYICAYDVVCTQTDFFENNGLAILMPTVCEITEELNGSYELVLTHPIDEFGKWKSLLELNIIKANGQLFRIYNKTTRLMSDGSRERTIYARHIFYDLNDKLLDDVRPENKNGKDFLDWIMNRIYDDDPQRHYLFYDYSWDSDIEKTATSYFQNISPVAALIGEDNCFVNRLGGELHRDNFYFSINTRKETSVEHIDSIRYSVDMLEIEEVVDYTDFCTLLFVEDNYGNGWGVSYTFSPRIHHNVVKKIKMNYEEPDRSGMIADGQAYFDTIRTPKVSYKIVFANLKNIELYKDFIKLQNYNIGDTVWIYCEELGIATLQKVVKKTVDVITGDTISMELGNMYNSLTRSDKFSNTISSGSAADKANAALEKELKNTKLKMLRNWGDAKKFKWNEVIGITWGEVKGVQK